MGCFQSICGFFSPISGEVRMDRQLDRQKVTHMSLPCNLHRWAQKLKIKCHFKAIVILQMTFLEIIKLKLKKICGAVNFENTGREEDPPIIRDKC